MKITKLGHCCLVVEVDGVRIMTDPGAYSTLQNGEKNIDIVLITHEHPDHLHVESLRTVLVNNPKAKVITNRGVGAILKEEGIAFELLEHAQNKTVAGILLEGFGEKHETIYGDYGQVLNTGYFLADKFFYPGDAFYIPASSAGGPQKKVEILALPVSAPWMKVSDAIDYAKRLKPKIAFPVHDGMLNQFGAVNHKLPATFLPPAGIAFEVIAVGAAKEF